MDQVVVECCAAASAAACCLQSKLQQCAPGDADHDDDDHDACDDEFSSCGQLDPSTGRERKEEEREKTDI